MVKGRNAVAFVMKYSIYQVLPPTRSPFLLAHVAYPHLGDYRQRTHRLGFTLGVYAHTWAEMEMLHGKKQYTLLGLVPRTTQEFVAGWGSLLLYLRGYPKAESFIGLTNANINLIWPYKQCPCCYEAGYPRSGAEFEHMQRCSKCQTSWAPGMTTDGVMSPADYVFSLPPVSFKEVRGWQAYFQADRLVTQYLPGSFWKEDAARSC